MLGALLALMSAVTFALNSALLRRGVITATVFQALVISALVGVPILAFGAIATGGVSVIPHMTPFQLTCFSIGGIVNFLFARYYSYRAIQDLGANLSNTMNQISLPLSLILAIVLLGETMTLLKLLGALLALSGPVLVLTRRGARPTARDFTPNYRTGFSFAILSSLGYGSAPLLIRAGLSDMEVGPHSGMAAGLVAYAVAAVVLMLLVLPSARARANVAAVDRGALSWLIVAGIMVGLSHFVLFVALSYAPVTVVVPITQSAVILSVITGWVVNRNHEIFDVRVLVAIGLTFVGVTVLALTPDMVADILGLPDPTRALLNRTWP